MRNILGGKRRVDMLFDCEVPEEQVFIVFENSKDGVKADVRAYHCLLPNPTSNIRFQTCLSYLSGLHTGTFSAVPPISLTRSSYVSETVVIHSLCVISAANHYTTAFQSTFRIPARIPCVLTPFCWHYSFCVVHTLS